MPFRRITVTIASLFVVVAAIACGSDEIPEATTVDSLTEALQAAGLRVKGPVENGFLASSWFSVPGVRLDASGEEVFAYEFGESEELAAQRSLVSPDGFGIGAKYIQWRVAPSYFQNGSLIVIYDGEERLVLDALGAAMGERFAGSDPA